MSITFFDTSPGHKATLQEPNKNIITAIEIRPAKDNEGNALSYWRARDP